MKNPTPHYLFWDCFESRFVLSFQTVEPNGSVLVLYTADPVKALSRRSVLHAQSYADFLNNVTACDIEVIPPTT